MNIIIAGWYRQSLPRLKECNGSGTFAANMIQQRKVVLTRNLELLRNQAAGLAAGGRLVLRSLVLANERDAGSARFRDWSAGEPVRPRLRSPEELGRILQEARLTVVSTTATSDAYALEVERTWGDAIDRIRLLHRDPAGRHIIPTMLAECERWQRRIELIRDGVLAVRQYVAKRRDRSRL